MGVLQDNLVLSTELIKWIGHRKRIQGNSNIPFKVGTDFTFCWLVKNTWYCLQIELTQTALHFNYFRRTSYVLSVAKSHITQTPSDRNSSLDQRNQLLTLIWQTEEIRSHPSKHSDMDGQSGPVLLVSDAFKNKVVEWRVESRTGRKGKRKVVVWGSASLHWFPYSNIE